MPSIIWDRFLGRLPKISTELLPVSTAQTAKNCDLQSGSLQPIKNPTQVQQITKTGEHRSIYKLGDIWIAWTGKINVVKADIFNDDNRIFFTGDGYPKQTTRTLAGSGAASTYPTATRRYGVTVPNRTLDISITGTAGEDPQDNVSYCFTHVVKWADGYEEESAPSPITAVVSLYDDQYNKLTIASGYTLPTIANSGNDVTHFRFYRTVTGSNGNTEYQLIKVSVGDANGPTQALAYDIPASSSVIVWDVDSVSSPTMLNQVFSDVLPADPWDLPPDLLDGLTLAPNGFNVGFKGNKLYLSYPLHPYAFPYTKSLPATIVAIGVLDDNIVVLTNSFPFVFTGSDPKYLSRIRINNNQANLSKSGTVETPHGIVYPSPEGLQIVSRGGMKNLTAGVFTKDQWLSLTPANLISFWHEGKYYGFFEGTRTGIVLDFRDSETPSLVDIELASGSLVYGGHVDPDTNTLFLLIKKADSNYYIESFASAVTKFTYTWASRPIIVPGWLNFSVGQVYGEFSGGATVTLKLYGDRVLLDTITVSSTEPFRFSSSVRAEEIYIEVSGTVVIKKIKIATSTEDLLNG